MTHQEDLHSQRVREQYSGSRGAEWVKARLRPLVTCSDCSLFLPRESDQVPEQNVQYRVDEEVWKGKLAKAAAKSKMAFSLIGWYPHELKTDLRFQQPNARKCGVRSTEDWESEVQQNQTTPTPALISRLPGTKKPRS
jgi:hypothetical protein